MPSDELNSLVFGLTGSYIRVFNPAKSEYIRSPFVTNAPVKLEERNGSADCVVDVVPEGTLKLLTYPNVSLSDDLETEAVIQLY